MMWSDGSYTGINIVLACTALQSMIVFIGAISVLNIDAKRKIRALILTVPTIHILNVFKMQASFTSMTHSPIGSGWGLECSSSLTPMLQELSPYLRCS